MAINCYDRRDFLRIVAASTATVGLSGCSASRPFGATEHPKRGDSITPPNVLFLMTDQLTASVLRFYGGKGVPTPNLEALAARGMTFDNMVSTCPVCTPFRSMWLTGRHPQTTGHVVNSMTTRYDEIGWGDVFSHAGYDTGYIGKWHLHRGSFPRFNGDFYIPEGRARLGFNWWRGYNLHADFLDGKINLGSGGKIVPWEGYETDALTKLTFEFLDHGRDPDKPFCLMVNPHQPHSGRIKGSDRMAPDKYYDRLPAKLPRPEALDAAAFKAFEKEYRDYYAMILAVDDMLGDMVAGLEKRGLLDSTIVVFTTDHGTQLGIYPIRNCSPFWAKKMHWETNVRTPMVIHWPEAFSGGRRCDTLTAPVDLLPTFCGLCNIKVPPTVEGIDLSRAWRGEEGAVEQHAVYMMNFTYRFDHCQDGWEWRGVRTKTHTYARYLDGKTYLFDNRRDPWQQNNLIDSEEHRQPAAEYEDMLQALMKKRNDKLWSGSHYRDWFDKKRRVVRNALGPLGDPESEPNWSLLK